MSENWNTEKIDDQAGRVVIVTGSSSGIGYEAARVLTNKGAEVIIAVRNREKGNAAAEKIRAQNKAVNVKVMLLDLADLASVKNFANEFKGQYSRLDLLINNAGVMIPPYGKTSDGFELQFGTNHLGHFALTGQLLGLLNKTKDARIINVSSGAHNAGNLNFDDLMWEKRKYSSWRAYGDSKIANLYFTYELNKKLRAAGAGTIATAAHPGYTDTELQRHSSIIAMGNSLLAQSISMGTLPTLRAATEPGLKGGEYFGPNGIFEMWGYPKRVESNKLSHNEGIAKRLWEVSEKLTGINFELEDKAAGV